MKLETKNTNETCIPHIAQPCERESPRTLKAALKSLQRDGGPVCICVYHDGEEECSQRSTDICSTFSLHYQGSSQWRCFRPHTTVNNNSRSVPDVRSVYNCCWAFSSKKVEHTTALFLSYMMYALFFCR
ncbi:Hypothetical predicted protein [Xyrichtys novacula]|uniref:Uncharacterized protein n=1 Tax=Xyrichtys novacula TaxID=13765 RepID=A0AAV1G8N3_XYRNO|nr:Hypothetical predicted protein [Xyrichtys novacula]